MSETLGLKNINLLTKEQYNGITEPATDELYAISGSGFGFPSDSRYVDLELGASGSRYRAPANGWFSFVSERTTASGQYCRLISLGSGMDFRQSSYASASGQWIEVVLPALRGQNIDVYYTALVSKFRFVYAEGEE